MPQRTNIEWTDYTSNPIRAEVDGRVGWHCEKVSAGCAHCYAEVINHRFGTRRPFVPSSRFNVECKLHKGELRRLLRMPSLAGQKVFLCDMTDLFGEWVPDEWLETLFAMATIRSDVTFQILTKRPKRAADWATTKDRWAFVEGQAHRLFAEYLDEPNANEWHAVNSWPTNVWMGTSIEDQPTAVQRIRELRRCPAAVRFLSCEPLLGPIDWLGALICAEAYYCGKCRNHFACAADALHCPNCGEDYDQPNQDGHCPHCGEADYENVCPACGLDGGNGGLSHSECCETEIIENAGQHIHWVLIGGESGPGARPCSTNDVRGLVQQCREALVPCYVKQLGRRPFLVENETQRSVGGVEVRLRDPKGGEPGEWPQDLRVREWPEATTPTATNKAREGAKARSEKAGR